MIYRVLIAHNPSEFTKTAARLKEAAERLSDVKATDLNDLGAGAGTLAEEIGSECGQCALIIGIIGERYGTVEARLGVPRYRWACDMASVLGVPLLAYFAIASGADECEEPLKKWRDVLFARHSPTSFGDDRELIIAVLSDLHNHLGKSPGSGKLGDPATFVPAPQEVISAPKAVDDLQVWVRYLVPPPLRPLVAKISAPWAFVIGLVMWQILQAGFSSPFAAWVGLWGKRAQIFTTLSPPDHAAIEAEDYFDGASIREDTKWDAPRTWELASSLQSPTVHQRLLIAGPGIGFFKPPDRWTNYFDYRVRFNLIIGDPKTDKGASWVMRYQGGDAYYRFDFIYPSPGANFAKLIAWRYFPREKPVKIGEQSYNYNPFRPMDKLIVESVTKDCHFEHKFVYSVSPCKKGKDCEDANDSTPRAYAEPISDDDRRHALIWGSPGFTSFMGRGQSEIASEFKFATDNGALALSDPASTREAGKSK